MKKVLITGANSYVGTNVEKWLLREPEKYYVETLDMKDPNWKNFDFSKFDVLLHVAGIVHIKQKRKNESLFYLINRDLAIETAKKAKTSKISHFIFLSSMSVYGMINGNIDENTIPHPKTYYGKSKYEAEKVIEKMDDSQFGVSIIRPPMVYGPLCKGNYMKLSKIAKRISFFPLISNNRSMIFISNLCEHIKIVIDEKKNGIFHPQNYNYVNTSDLVKKIASCYNHKLLLFHGLSFLTNLTRKTKINQVFGTLVYEKSLSLDIERYNVVNFIESIEISEKCQPHSIYEKDQS